LPRHDQTPADRPSSRDAYERDDALVRRFGDLYEEQYTHVLAYAVSKARDRHAGEDVAAEAFTRLWTELRAGKAIVSPPAWLFTTVRRLVIDRGRRLRGESCHDLAHGAAPFDVVDTRPSADPFAEAARKDLEALSWNELAGVLSDQERALLTLHYRQDLSVDELADVLKDAKGSPLTRGAVYTQLSRARTSFKRAVMSRLLLYDGPPRCASLDGQLAAQSRCLTPETHTAIQAHLQSCAICQETERRLEPQAVVLSGLTLIHVSPLLGAPVWLVSPICRFRKRLGCVEK